MIGQTISHYKILEKLGEGGMGIVYRAEDTKLKRTVALKFLPKGLEAHEPERARFLQEAQAASALNHPNICAIHALGEHEGQQFIDMEFVDGVTLRNKIVVAIHESPLRVDDVLSFAIQVGEALQEAHSKGIVHRDVKCENIMVNSKNQIKVMDFGLAKLKGSLKLTRTSSTVGTLAYMAPEQIQGGEVDARSDIFSFGIVLFELLTGRLPFRGEHEAAMMYSIVNETPLDVCSLRNDVTPDLKHVLARMLEKDPQDRYQAITEIINELQRIRRHSNRVQFPSSSASEIPPRESSPSRKWRIVGIASLAILITVFGVWFIKFHSGEHASVLNPNRSFNVLQVPFHEIDNCSISSDGNWIAFAASDESQRSNVYITNAASTSVRKLINDSLSGGILSVDVSPDGSQVVFSRGETKSGRQTWTIYLVDVLGGEPRRVDEGFFARWRPDGQQFGYFKLAPYLPTKSGSDEFWTARSDGRETHVQIVDTATGSIRRAGLFAWSPDGQSIATIRNFAEGYEELFIRDLRSGQERQCTFNKASMSDVAWVRPNGIVYTSGKSNLSDLWLLQPNSGTINRITHGEVNHRRLRGSTDGKRLICLQRSEVGNMRAATIGGTKTETVITDEANIRQYDPSPDGKVIAWATGGGNNKLFCMKRDGTNRQQIWQTDSTVVGIKWSPDGKKLAFCVLAFRYINPENPLDQIQTYVVDPYSPSSPRSVSNGLVMTWPDSATLLVIRSSGTWLCPIDGAPPKKCFKDSTVAFPVVNGKYVFYREHDSSWIAPVDGSIPPRKITVTAGKRKHEVYVFAFSPDNTFLTVFSDDRTLGRLYFPSGTLKKLNAPLPDTSDHTVSDFSITRNGKELFYLQRANQSRIVLMDNLFEK